MKRLAICTCLLLVLAVRAGAVGFQTVTAAGPEGQPLELSIWYPSDAPARPEPFGPFPQIVAPDGALRGSDLPLVVLSHGTGGTPLNHYETAIALAEAGFVVVGLLQTGDNYRDHRVSFSRANFAGRPRQVSRAIDFMTRAWAGHGAINDSRIGFLGHSAGGTTGLIVAGGRLDPKEILGFCRAHPDDWGCVNGSRAATPDAWADPSPVEGRDARIKAVVLAAPALGSAFLPHGLDGITVPVQLWVGGEDTIVTDAAVVRGALPVAPEYHLVARGGHFAYLTPCSADLAAIASEICSDPPGFDRVAFLRSFDDEVILFFRKKLK